ncbi:MAG TPA: hypothetical protein VGI03_02275 [Verrucomicrobiae bacterium]|jgi:hypothetical protein
MNKSCFSRLIGSCGLLTALAGALVPFRASAQVQDPYFGPTLGPAVRIFSPANHQIFLTPIDVPVLAYTRSEATFSNVEFYANGIDLGPGVNLAVANHAVYKTLASPDVMLPGVMNRLHGLWCFVWTNAPAGAYALTAVASGHELEVPTISLNRTSAPVNITILTPVTPPTPTNDVSIVAVDPIAIADTNASWIWQGLTNDVPSWTYWPPIRWGYYTNWGPKAALFTVFRSGDDSTDEVVNYSIGGTASNGVDYAALPGVVTISAGTARAQIPIVPIDSGSNNIAKTVVLALQPSTNSPPDYFVSCHSNAEAIILYRWPRPLPWLLLDGSFHFNSSAPDGAWFALQNSTDLVNWTSLGTNQAFQGSIDFIDPNAPGSPSGFYQIVPLTNAPSD